MSAIALANCRRHYKSYRLKVNMKGDRAHTPRVVSSLRFIVLLVHAIALFAKTTMVMWGRPGLVVAPLELRICTIDSLHAKVLKSSTQTQCVHKINAQTLARGIWLSSPWSRCVGAAEAVVVETAHCRFLMLLHNDCDVTLFSLWTHANASAWAGG